MDHKEIRQFVNMERMLEFYGVELGSGRRCACPIHGGDNKTAFVVSNDSQLWECKTKCECGGDVFTFVEKKEGLTKGQARIRVMEMFGLSEDAKPVKPKSKPKSTKVVSRTDYIYRDKDGVELYRSKRVDYDDNHKDCFQECNGKGTLPPEVRTLYNYDKIYGGQDCVIICEGEKTADAVTKCGYIGTTNPLGSKNWDDSYAKLLTGRKIIVMPDADEHGEKWRDSVIESLCGIADQVQTINIPDEFVSAHDEFSGHDFADYVAVLGEEDGVLLIEDGIENSKVFPSGVDPKIMGRPADGFREIQRRVRAGISTEVFNIQEWLPSFDIPVNKGDLIVLMANTSVGKTRLAHNMPFFIRSVNYVMFDLELSFETLCQRYGAMMNNCSFKGVLDKMKAGYDIKIPNVDNVSIQKVEKLTVDKIRERVNLLEKITGKEQHVVCVDYIGLMSGSGSSYEVTSNNVESFKAYVAESGKVGVLTTQVSRPENKVDGMNLCPSPFSAKNSGSIENSAQVLFGFWKDKYNSDRLWAKCLKYSHGDYTQEDIPLDAKDLVITEAAQIQ